MTNIKELEKKYQELWEEIERLKQANNKLDFSKFVGRREDILCIFGEKVMLKSLDDWSLMFDNDNREQYNNKLNYIECKISELKIWDIFCLVKKEISDYNKTQFYYYVWVIDNEVISQCINWTKCERIVEFYFSGLTKVYKFLRE